MALKFGKEWVKYILHKHKSLKKLVIFSRDELKQYEMEKEYSLKNLHIRYFIGTLETVMIRICFREIDYVIHAAALKQVPTAEYNPIETIKTNIIGAQNLMTGLKNQVQVIALSTDKACHQ